MIFPETATTPPSHVSTIWRKKCCHWTFRVPTFALTSSGKCQCKSESSLAVFSHISALVRSYRRATCETVMKTELWRIPLLFLYPHGFDTTANVLKQPWIWVAQASAEEYPSADNAGENQRRRLNKHIQNSCSKPLKTTTVLYVSHCDVNKSLLQTLFFAAANKSPWLHVPFLGLGRWDRVLAALISVGLCGNKKRNYRHSLRSVYS